jgi:hypothetical protein
MNVLYDSSRMDVSSLLQIIATGFSPRYWYHKTAILRLLVRKITIPTDCPPLVVEVMPTLAGSVVSRGQCNGPQRPLMSVF